MRTHDLDDPDDPLRILRSVGPPEAPYPGYFAHDDGTPSLAVPIGSLRGWEGWSVSGAHVIAPRDMGGTPRLGTLALLPWCPRTLLGLIGDRGARLSDGESATIIVSVLRGWRQLRDDALARRIATPAGAWWVTEDGMPVYAPAVDPPASAPAAEEESIAVLHALARAAPHGARAVEQCLALARNGRMDEAEAHAFAIAEPEPLRWDPEPGSAGAEGAGEAARMRSTWREVDGGGVEETEGHRPGVRARVAGTVRRALERHVDRDMAATVHEAFGTPADRAATAGECRRGRIARRDRMPRRDRIARRDRTDPVVTARQAPRAPRRVRPLWIGVGAAAVVLAIGLAWPAGEEAADRASADGPGAAAASSDHDEGAGVRDTTGGASAPGADETAGDADAGDADVGDADAAEREAAGREASAGDADPVAVLEALLVERATCLLAERCAPELPNGEPWPEGASERRPEERTIAIVDDLGAAAVLRVDPAGDADSAASQHVVITEGVAGWRITEVRSIP